jgi:HPt (histidine-containing phosphotransfer) domain-containing protein
MECVATSTFFSTPQALMQPDLEAFFELSLTTANVAATTIDRAQALAFAGGDARLLRELARLFLDAYLAELAAVRAACARHDLPALQRAAHAMKGSIRIFDAAAFEAALRVETLAHAGDADQVAAACAGLEKALAGLQPALAALAAE